MVAPIAAVIWLAFTGRLALATSTMACYLLTLVAQQLSEGWFIQRSEISALLVHPHRWRLSECKLAMSQC